MKKMYLTTLMMLLLLVSCGTSENNNVKDSNNQNNQENEEVKEKVSKEGLELKKYSDKEQKISKIQDNVVHGKLTLTDQKKQGAYYDEKNQTKYILGENSTIKKSLINLTAMFLHLNSCKKMLRKLTNILVEFIVIIQNQLVNIIKLLIKTNLQIIL